MLATLPLELPALTINPWTLKAFNTLYYAAGRMKSGRMQRVHYAPFFYPLDQIRNWNRAYGSRGFRPIFDAAPPDLTISARSRDFIALLAREEDPDTLFFSRRLLMEGDTDLGLLVKNTLDGIELPRLDPARLKPAEVLRRLRERLATPHTT